RRRESSIRDVSPQPRSASIHPDAADNATPLRDSIGMRTMDATSSRRHFVLGAAGTLAAAALPQPARAGIPTPYSWDASPPTARRADFIDWMVKNRGEDAGFLGQRWDRLQQLVASRDISDPRTVRAYLMTPREEFVTRENLGRAYEWHYLNIGYGVTI